MKKLFGVVMLAALPIACGTDPTAPTASFAEARPPHRTSFAASARVRAHLLGEGGLVDGEGRGRSTWRGRDRGSVTVRADLMVLGGDGAGAVLHARSSR